MTKFVRSRWFDIGVVLFLRVCGAWLFCLLKETFKSHLEGKYRTWFTS